MFLIFAAYFLSKYKYYKTDLYTIVIAFGMVILTQSRTCLVALFAMILFFTIVNNKLKIKNIISSFLIFVIFIASTLLILYLLNSKYISKLWNMPLEQNVSLYNRVVKWKYLSGIILENPIIGSGGSKDFLYTNGILVDGHYVLIAFLFGFIGLFFFLLLLFYPFYYYKKNKNLYSLATAMFFVPIIITSTTNAPLNDYRLFLIIISFMAMSCSYSTFNKPKKILTDQNVEQKKL